MGRENPLVTALKRQASRGLSADETAAAIKMHRTTVYKLIRSGLIPSFIENGFLRVPKAFVRRAEQQLAEAEKETAPG